MASGPPDSDPAPPPAPPLARGGGRVQWTRVDAADAWVAIVGELRLSVQRRGGRWMAEVEQPGRPRGDPLAPAWWRAERGDDAAARRAAAACARVWPPPPDPIRELVVHLERGAAPPLRWLVAWSRHAGRDPVASAWAASRDGHAMRELLDWHAERAGLHALRSTDHAAGSGHEVARALLAYCPAPPPLEALLAARAVAPQPRIPWTPPYARTGRDLVDADAHTVRVLEPTGVLVRRPVRHWRFRDELEPPRGTWAPVWALALAVRTDAPIVARREQVARVAADGGLVPPAGTDPGAWAAALLGVPPPRPGGWWDYRPPPRPRVRRARRAGGAREDLGDGPLFTWARGRGG